MTNAIKLTKPRVLATKERNTMTITEIEGELTTQTARRDALSRQLEEGSAKARNARRALTAAIADGVSESEVAKLRATSTKAAEHAVDTAEAIPLIVSEISRLEGELELARSSALAQEMTAALSEWGASLDEADDLIVNFFRDVLQPHHAKISDAFSRAREAEKKLYVSRENRPATSELEYPKRYAKRSGGRAASVLQALAAMCEGRDFAMQHGGVSVTNSIRPDARLSRAGISANSGDQMRADDSRLATAGIN
jgi:hypothetical protein